MGHRKVVLVGAHGHGRWHLANVRRLEAAGIAELIGVCDFTAVDPQTLGGRPVAQSPSLQQLVGDVRPEIAIICTPIHTHVELALTAMRAGAHVLLEKPPAPSLDEFNRLLDAANGMGRVCQVGFQSLASDAVEKARTLIASGRIGALRGIGGAGAWIRDSSYYARATWAGKRHLDGRPVVDGVLTNPFAHAIATALRLAGAETAGEIARVESELFHAHAIESDDTSSVRITTWTGVPITIAATLCAQTSRDPYLIAHGTDGFLVLNYTRDELLLHTTDGVESFTGARVDLLANLITHLDDPAVPLMVPLSSSAAFMEVVDAIREAPDPQQVPTDYLELVEHGSATRLIIAGINTFIDKSAETGQLFSELGIDWAGPAAGSRTGGVAS